MQALFVVQVYHAMTSFESTVQTDQLTLHILLACILFLTQLGRSMLLQAARETPQTATIVTDEGCRTWNVCILAFRWFETTN